MNTIPNKDNSCGGNYQEWLDVMLEPRCNGSCPFCVEKNGYRPKSKVTTQEIINAVLKSKKHKVNLLGGEPTLYENLATVIYELRFNGVEVYLTTNGSKVTPEFVESTLKHLTGINLSIHDYDLSENKKVTGIVLDKSILKDSIKKLNSYGVAVRLNCNCAQGHIDSKKSIEKYLKFSKELGVHNVKFSELIDSKQQFVDLYKIYPNKYGINVDPFLYGCSKNAVINGIDVSFRQMCGLMTPTRIPPKNPTVIDKPVLYYDGKMYNGWQVKEGDFFTNAVESNNGEIKMLRKHVGEVK